MKYKVTHTTKYAYSEAVPVCHNLVHLAPRQLPYQNCTDHRLLVHPQPTQLDHRTDSFGNQISYFSIDQPHLRLTVTSTSHVQVSERPRFEPSATPPWEQLANELQQASTDETLAAYPFTLPSPGIVLFDGMADYVQASFSPHQPILESVLDLTRRIYEDFEYAPRTTKVNTSTEEVFNKRQGVCQDFAHLQIGCLRALGLAARYVSGYVRTEPPKGQPRLVGADASHAWLSVYCGLAGWIDFDPTNNVLASTDHITVAWGRDYNDVCPIQGVIVGGGEHRMSVAVDVAPVGKTEDAVA